MRTTKKKNIKELLEFLNEMDSYNDVDLKNYVNTNGKVLGNEASTAKINIKGILRKNKFVQ